MRRSIFLVLAVLTTCAASAEPNATDAQAYIRRLDAVIKDAAPALKSGELKTHAELTQRINALSKEGELFGNTVWDQPYGYCFGAGIQVRSWWQAQMAAARNGGVETPKGMIANAAKEYATQRAACLDAAQKPQAKIVRIESTSETPPHRDCLKVLGIKPNGEIGTVAYTCPTK